MNRGAKTSVTIKNSKYWLGQAFENPTTALLDKVRNFGRLPIIIASYFLLLVLLFGNFTSNAPTNVQVLAVDTNPVVTGQTNQTQSYVNVANSIGFKECTFGYQDPNKGNDAFQKCLKQIFSFFFVAGIFFVAIRIAVEALGSLNPFEKGKAVDNSVKLIGDVVIGLLLLGAPGLFLQIFNPSALNIDIIKSLIPTNSSKTQYDPPASGFSNTELAQATTKDSVANKKLNDLILAAIQDLQGKNTSPIDIQKLKAAYDQGDQKVKDYINSQLPALNPIQTANIRYLPGKFSVLSTTPVANIPGAYKIQLKKISDDFPNKIVSPQTFDLYAKPKSGSPTACQSIQAVSKDTISGAINASDNCLVTLSNNLN